MESLGSELLWRSDGINGQSLRGTSASEGGCGFQPHCPDRELSLPSPDLCIVSSAALLIVVLRGEQAVAKLFQCEQGEMGGVRSSTQAAGIECPQARPQKAVRPWMLCKSEN